MKKYYEYDAPVLTKLVSIVAIVAICVSMFTSAFCCYKIASMNTNVAPANSATANVPSNGTAGTPSGDTNSTPSGGDAQSNDPAPAPSGTDAPAPSGDNNSQGGSTGNTDAPAPSGGIKGLSTNEEIVKKYTDLISKAKTSKIGFTKKEYQALPKEFHNLGSLGNVILPIAEGFMTKEDKAQEQLSAKGEDHAGRWPISSSKTVGCTLTDMSAIKSATAKQDGDMITLTIVLKDESNPEPSSTPDGKAPSKHGAMFSPMSKADIDKTISGIKAVKVNSFDLTYTDCTATLVYNSKNDQIQSLTQIMNIDINANVKALVVTIDGSARLINTMKIYDVKY